MTAQKSARDFDLQRLTMTGRGHANTGAYGHVSPRPRCTKCCSEQEFRDQLCAQDARVLEVARRTLRAEALGASKAEVLDVEVLAGGF